MVPRVKLIKQLPKKEIPPVNQEPDYIPIPPNVRKIAVGKKGPKDKLITIEADYGGIPLEIKI